MKGDEVRSLVNVALGKEPADLVIKKGKLVNVYTGEVLDGSSVSVKGDKIAYVGKDAGHTVGEGTRVIEAEGRTVIPGLIDGHTHISISPIDGFIERAMCCGTTTLMIDTLEMGRSVKMGGVPPLLDALKDQPINVYPLLPSPVFPLPLLGEKLLYPTSEVGALLARKEPIGLGETLWPGVFNDNDDLFDLFARVLNEGKKLEGHSSALKNSGLVAYFASGISSCHEAVTLEEAVDRLRLGVCTMIREGSIRRELDAIAPIKDRGLDMRNLALISDNISADEHLKLGHMDYIVQRAINLGFDPVQAIRMATVNVAQHFSLDRLGGLAPGKQADMVIIPDVRTIRPEMVFCKGDLVAEGGRPLKQVRKPQLPPWMLQTMRFPRRLEAGDFRIPARGRVGQARARVIEVTGRVLTRKSLADLPVEGDEVKVDLAQDVIKVASLERQTSSGEFFVGLVKGFGLKRGAFACSYSWGLKSPSVVVGADDADMALAVNRMLELQGGIVLCSGGRVLGELPLPVGSYITTCSLEETASRIDSMWKHLKEMGCNLEAPFLSVQTLGAVAIPYFRISPDGVIDVVKQEYMDLLMD